MKNILGLILIGAGFWSSTGWGLDSPATPVVKVSTTLVTRTSSRPQSPSPNGLSLMQTALLQTALDRNGFGVGLIDGQAGSRTTLALRDYARSRGLSEPDARAELLGDTEPATIIHTLTNEDLASVGTAPGDWAEAEKVSSMACGSLDEVLSERFHASRRFLQRLNPALTNWSGIATGTEVTVPNTRPTSWSVPASRLEVDCTEYRIRAFGATNDLIASFPCSIARKLHKVPVGDLTLVAFAPNPNYTFDPENFPESARAQEIGRKIIIPPGPRNPVGVYWLSLSAPGFGMHGTPHPETIGRRESHGCFRLTNWDITTLASMVEVGTPVRVMNVPAEDAE
jgi:lipoprotein-anchoring transpeptidase ErfK/SrfK